MTTIFTSAPSATTSADISLTWLLEESLHYETFISILGSENQNNGRSYARLSISDDLKKNLGKKSPPTTYLELILHLFKVLIFPLTSNLNVTKCEVKRAVNIGHGRGSSTIPLKAQLEYSHGNYHKAIKLLIMCAKLLENQSKWCHLNFGTISVVYITNWEKTGWQLYISRRLVRIVCQFMPPFCRATT